MAEKIMAETEKEIAEQVTARKAELEEHQKNQNIAEPEISATKKVDTDDIRGFCSPGGQECRQR